MVFTRKRKIFFKPKKQKTIAQLNKEIAEQRERISKEETISKRISEKNKLSRQLFELKNRKLIGAGAKAKRLSKRFGKSLLKVGQKAAPIIKKQARLIRDQQLRDDAIAKARLKRSKKIPLTTKTIEKFVPIKRKGKKTLFKKGMHKDKIPKKSKPKQQQNLDVFGNLDF